MKLLIVDKWLHHKNKIGLNLMLEYIKRNNLIENFVYYYGTANDLKNNKWDVVFSPATPIQTNKFPKTKFIFGPHFSVFPNQMLTLIKNQYKNAVYIQPSNWCTEIWKSMGAETILPIITQPFAVDTEKFVSLDLLTKRNKIMIYYKRRTETELNVLENFLREKKLDYKLFNYVEKYEEEDYLTTLQTAKFMIVLDAHESQGFALQEAMACNVPLLVWSVTSMNQEIGANHPDFTATTIPYWSDKCGEVFYKWEEFEKIFNVFLKNIKNEKYKPRQFILETLSEKQCSMQFLKLIGSFN